MFDFHVDLSIVMERYIEFEKGMGCVRRPTKTSTEPVFSEIRGSLFAALLRYTTFYGGRSLTYMLSDHTELCSVLITSGHEAYHF